MKKKIICLYRVSTNKQVNHEADIPVQRETCKEYIDNHNQQYGDEWEFYTEILEGGVSAYHKDIEEREIQQVIDIASEHPQEKFVLLAFYSDRISRQDINGITFIDKLHRLGVEVWTVQEGNLKMDSEMDRLMMFIKFWGNNNESRKTANRVYAARKVLTEAGIWTGGTVPYGYTLEPTGEINKKGRVVNDLVRHPEESVIVKEMFNKLVYGDFTINGIMEALNSRGSKTKRGCRWSTTTIKNILKNPIYKGYIAYNKTTQKGYGRQKETDRSQWVLAKEKNESYVIIKENVWEMAQVILARRSRAYHESLRVTADKTYKSKLLLAGLLVCGHCGTTISPAVSSQWTGKKKERKTYIEYYRCNLRAKGKKQCKAKTYISAKKLEQAVLEQIYAYLEGLQKIDCTKEIERMIAEESMVDMERLRRLSKEHQEAVKKKGMLEEEMIKSIMGDSALSKENINMALDDQEKMIKRLEGEIGETEYTLEEKKRSMKEMVALQKLIPVWRDVFGAASLNVKKHLLSLLIEKITVTGNKVEIFFKITAERFWDKVNLHEEYILPCKDGSTHLPHHIMPQMLPFEAIAPGCPKVIKFCVRKSLGDGGEGL